MLIFKKIDPARCWVNSIQVDEMLNIFAFCASLQLTVQISDEGTSSTEKCLLYYRLFSEAVFTFFWKHQILQKSDAFFRHWATVLTLSYHLTSLEKHTLATFVLMQRQSMTALTHILRITAAALDWPFWKIFRNWQSSSSGKKQIWVTTTSNSSCRSKHVTRN